MLPDMLPALRQRLIDRHLVEGDRVFDVELPANQAVSMPRKAVVLRLAGGTARSYVTINRSRVDVRCYGETNYEARQVYLAIHEDLKRMTPVAHNHVWFLNAILEGGPFEMRDPDTDWPFVLSSWLVMSREVAVA